jgi:hypothetical protein
MVAEDGDSTVGSVVAGRDGSVKKLSGKKPRA